MSHKSNCKNKAYDTNDNFVHFLFKCCVWRMNESLRSNINKSINQTKRIAVYLGAQCNIRGWKRACYHLTSDVELWSNVVRSVVDGSDRRNLFFFRGLIAPKPYVPHQNSRTKGTSLGCRLIPRNNSHCTKLCRLNCTSTTNTPSKAPIFSCFGTCKTHCAEIQKSFIGLRMRHTDSRLLFQKWLKSVQDKSPKVRIVLVTEKKQNTFWHP